MFWHNFKYELITCFRVKDVLFWLMLFPIVLGLFFKAAFGGIYDKDFSNAAIKTAVVETTENENFSAVLDSLSSGDDAMLKITRTDMESAQKKLEDKSIDAIICVDGEISLQVRKNSTESTILERIVNQYTVNEKIISDTLKSDPSALAAVVSQLTGNTDYTENIRLADKRTDIYDQYFYNLIAMVALFSSISGLHIAIQNQGNLSELGARKCISPTPKFISMTASLSGTYILGIICVALCVSFVRFVLGISLGEDLILTYFAAIVGSILGTNTGFFIGSLNRINETVKTGFSIAFSLLSCFFSGLMTGDMKGKIEATCPIINRLNPSALISDAIYNITVFGDTKSYWHCIITMTAEAAVFAVLGILMTRRRKYDSI